LLEPHPVPHAAAVPAALMLAAIAGLRFDALGGIVVALALGAALTALKRLDGVWVPEMFWPAATETVALIVAASCAGWAGRQLGSPGLEGAREAAEPARTIVAPAFGSLGLLEADLGMARLEEEVERAREHARPLALAVFSAVPVDESLSAQGRSAGLRVLARAIETRLRKTDIPFALNEDEIAAILPETDPLDAWDQVSPITEAVVATSFRDRATETERRFSDRFVLNIGIAAPGPGVTSADALLDAAITAVRRDAAVHEMAR
jgi:GGDEF domain-containing protein